MTKAVDRGTTELEPLPLSKNQVIGPVLAGGFGIAVATWCVWFITHVPWTGVAEPVAIGLVLTTWLAAAIVFGKYLDRPRHLMIGALAGGLASVLGLLLVGTRLTAHAPGVEALSRPNVLLVIPAFLAMGATIGLVGAWLGRAIAPPRAHATTRQDWLARLAWVAVVAIAPLLFIGGLVTSTNAGMAVPDWPTTYGANMFLYPLRPDLAKGLTEGMSYTDVFLEHSHRLFGSLIGLATLSLMVLTLAVERRGWVKGLAVAVFALVCVQGILGGKRVLLGSNVVELDNRWYSMAHGVLGQLVFALAVWLAAVVSPVFVRALEGPAPAPARATLLRVCATGTLHATVLQLVFGAMYRHHRHEHALYAHIGFAIVVLVMAMLAGVAATAVRGEAPIARTVRRVGGATLGVVIAQFSLGWLAFFAGGRGIEATTTTEALIRTAHQANGAIFLALSVALLVFGKRALRAARSAGGASAPVQGP